MVRPGVWSRSVCMNENLEIGSMLPMIEKAIKNNVSILIMNPNTKTDPDSGLLIPKCSTMESHVNYVWEKYVGPSKFKKLYIVAHSKGGACLGSLMKNGGKAFFKRIEKIAIVDSKHFGKFNHDTAYRQLMLEKCVHFIANEKAAGTKLVFDRLKDHCPKYSAGHPKHEYTTGFAQNEIFKLFNFK